MTTTTTTMTMMMMSMKRTLTRATWTGQEEECGADEELYTGMPFTFKFADSPNVSPPLLRFSLPPSSFYPSSRFLFSCASEIT
eukprot:3397963-Rhodomonas_salina.5